MSFQVGDKVKITLSSVSQFCGLTGVILKINNDSGLLKLKLFVTNNEYIEYYIHPTRVTFLEKGTKKERGFKKWISTLEMK